MKFSLFELRMPLIIADTSSLIKCMSDPFIICKLESCQSRESHIHFNYFKLNSLHRRLTCFVLHFLRFRFFFLSFFSHSYQRGSLNAIALFDSLLKKSFFYCFSYLIWTRLKIECHVNIICDKFFETINVDLAANNEEQRKKMCTKPYLQFDIKRSAFRWRDIFLFL